MAEPVNRVMFTTAAARDFVSGITSSVSGYKILTGNTIGSANIHINIRSVRVFKRRLDRTAKTF